MRQRGGDGQDTNPRVSHERIAHEQFSRKEKAGGTGNDFLSHRPVIRSGGPPLASLHGVRLRGTGLLLRLLGRIALEQQE